MAEMLPREALDRIERDGVVPDEEWDALLALARVGLEYENAVNGRREFREMYRRERARVSPLEAVAMDAAKIARYIYGAAGAVPMGVGDIADLIDSLAAVGMKVEE